MFVYNSHFILHFLSSHLSIVSTLSEPWVCVCMLPFVIDLGRCWASAILCLLLLSSSSPSWVLVSLCSLLYYNPVWHNSSLSRQSLNREPLVVQSLSLSSSCKLLCQAVSIVTPPATTHLPTHSPHIVCWFWASVNHVGCSIWSEEEEEEVIGTKLQWPQFQLQNTQHQHSSLQDSVHSGPHEKPKLAFLKLLGRISIHYRHCRILILQEKVTVAATQVSKISFCATILDLGWWVIEDRPKFLPEFLAFNCRQADCFVVVAASLLSPHTQDGCGWELLRQSFSFPSCPVTASAGLC